MSLLTTQRQKGIRAYDLFTRDDSALTLGTSGSGHTWTANQGTWGISSNKGYCAATSGGFGAATLDPGLADTVVEVDFTYQTNGGGIYARFVDTNNHLLWQVVSTSQINLSKRVASSTTHLATPAHTFVAGNTYSLRLECAGSTIRGYVDDVLLTTHYLTAAEQALFLTPTLSGIRSTGTTDRFDNFVVRRA